MLHGQPSIDRPPTAPRSLPENAPSRTRPPPLNLHTHFDPKGLDRLLPDIMAHGRKTSRSTTSMDECEGGIFMPSPLDLPSPLFPPPSIQTLDSACPGSVDSTNEKTPLLSHLPHGSLHDRGAPQSGTNSGTKISVAGVISAVKLLLAALATAIDIKIHNLIENFIDTFTDDEREDKDELIFPLGSWDCDFVGQAGETLDDMARLDGVVVGEEIKDGVPVTKV